MKKKFTLLLIVALIIVFALTGCSKKVNKVEIGGNVKSGNNSFLVEKGDYVYFVNGKQDVTADNKIGEVNKGSLCRVKKSDLNNLSNANVETVISKIIFTGNSQSSFYMLDNNVYFASPYTEKDKTGSVQNYKLAIKKYDTSKGKYNEKENVVVLNSNTEKFYFYNNGGTVYVVYTLTDGSTKTIKCVNADNGKEVFTSDSYDSILMPEDNSGNIYFVKASYSNNLKKNEDFNEIYLYQVGSDSAKLMIKGCGSNSYSRDDNKTLPESKKCNIAGMDGVKFELIKNTGKVLIFSATHNGSSLKYYYGIQSGNLNDFGGKVELGIDDVITSKVFTSSAYYGDLDLTGTENKGIVYFVNNGGLRRYIVPSDINNIEENEEKYTVLVNKNLENLSIVSVIDSDMYLCNTAEGYYYKCKYETINAEKRQINAGKMSTPSDFYKPRIIDNKYFITTYQNSNFGSYLYVVNMDGIDADNLQDKDINAYQENIEKLSKDIQSTANTLYKGLLGKMIDEDKTVFEDYVNGLNKE